MMRDPPLDKPLLLQKHGRPDGLSQNERITQLFAADPLEDRAEPFFELRDRLFEKTPAETAAGRPGAMKGIIGILSPDGGDGRSHVAANLAAVLAHGGVRTLLVDGDVHHPRLHTLLHTPARTGFSALRSEVQEVHEMPVHRLERTHVLSLLAGTEGGEAAESSIVRQEPGLRDLLQHCRSRFDCVVFDTPPASSSRDALLIAACCDIVVIVGRKGHTRMSDLKKLVNRVARSGTRIGGVIINDR